MKGGVEGTMLNREEIRKLIEEKELINNYFSLDIQLTPNGFDLTTGAVFEFIESGMLDFSNKERVIPETKELIPSRKNQSDKFGWWALRPGAYKVKTNEVVNLPKDVIAISFPRSSLLRMGAFVQNAVWDAGFRGNGEFVLVVQNPKGLKLKQNARIVQLIFNKITETNYGYQGIFQQK